MAAIGQIKYTLIIKFGFDKTIAEDRRGRNLAGLGQVREEAAAGEFFRVAVRSSTFYSAFMRADARTF